MALRFTSQPFNIIDQVFDSLQCLQLMPILGSHGKNKGHSFHTPAQIYSLVSSHVSYTMKQNHNLYDEECNHCRGWGFFKKLRRTTILWVVNCNLSWIEVRLSPKNLRAISGSQWCMTSSRNKWTQTQHRFAACNCYLSQMSVLAADCPQEAEDNLGLMMIHDTFKLQLWFACHTPQLASNGGPSESFMKKSPKKLREILGLQWHMTPSIYVSLARNLSYSTNQVLWLMCQRHA